MTKLKIVARFSTFKIIAYYKYREKMASMGVRQWAGLDVQIYQETYIMQFYGSTMLLALVTTLKFGALYLLAIKCLMVGGWVVVKNLTHSVNMRSVYAHAKSMQPACMEETSEEEEEERKHWTLLHVRPWCMAGLVACRDTH